MVRLGDEVFQSYVLPAKPVGACGDVASRVLPRHMGARLHHGHAECLAEGPAREQRQATQGNNRPHATTIPPRAPEAVFPFCLLCNYAFGMHNCKYGLLYRAVAGAGIEAGGIAVSSDC